MRSLELDAFGADAVEGATLGAVDPAVELLGVGEQCGFAHGARGVTGQGAPARALGACHHRGRVGREAREGVAAGAAGAASWLGNVRRTGDGEVPLAGAAIALHHGLALPMSGGVGVEVFGAAWAEAGAEHGDSRIARCGVDREASDDDCDRGGEGACGGET